LGFGAVKRPLLDHVHRFDAGNEDARAAKGLEPEHGSRDAFDRPVILLDDVVEVLRLAQLLSMVIVSGTPCSSMARSKNRLAAA